MHQHEVVLIFLHTEQQAPTQKLSIVGVVHAFWDKQAKLSHSCAINVGPVKEALTFPGKPWVQQAEV